MKNGVFVGGGDANNTKPTKTKHYLMNPKPSGIQKRAEDSQQHEGEERADIQCIEHRRNDVPEQVQVRITQVPDSRQWLPIPGNVGEPTQQNPNHQDSTVDVEPLGDRAGHQRHRRADSPIPTTVIYRGEEERPRRADQRLP